MSSKSKSKWVQEAEQEQEHAVALWAAEEEQQQEQARGGATARDKCVWPMRLPCGQQKQQMARLALLYLTSFRND